MKAQGSIEFILSVAMLLITVVYSMVTILNILPVYTQQSISEYGNSMAFQFSQYVLFSGELTENFYVLDGDKITDLNSEAGKEKIKNEMGFRDTESFSVRITSLDQEEILSILPDEFTGQTRKSVIDRIAILNDELVRVEVMVG